MLEKKEILDIFEQSGGLLSGHFLLTSGRHSDRYMQCAKLFMRADLSQKLCEALCNKLEKYQIDLVVSPAIGGIIFGYEMSRFLKCPNIFAERVDGAMQLRRGFEVPQGARIAVVEDVITTGGSVKEVIELCRSMGGNVVVASCLADRSNGKVQFDVPLEALLSVDVTSYEAHECPICKSGAPLVKPGSRQIIK